MAAHEGPREDEELRRVRERKLQRYRRLAHLAEEGADWPKGPVDAPTEAALAFLRKYPAVLLEFWAQWCRPCVTMRPLLDDLAGEYWGDVAFARVNVDENPDAREVWGVSVLPTLIIAKHGLEVSRLQGALTRGRLLKELAPYASDPEARVQRVGRLTPPGERGD